MYFSRSVLTVAATLIAAVGSASSISAQTDFANGSFEQPLVPGAGVWWKNPTSLPGWNAPTGLSSTFNLHGSIWPSAEGAQHIEFDDRGATLEQSVSGLVIGVEYTVLFALAGNPDRQTTYGLRVEVLDAGVIQGQGEFSVSSVGHSRTDPGWSEHSISVVASAPTMLFRFIRTDNQPNGWGPDLDHVRLRASCPADVNGDGFLTPTDFTAWINAFNNNLPGCDQNADGFCTPTDFTAWIANFNAGC